MTRRCGIIKQAKRFAVHSPSLFFIFLHKSFFFYRGRNFLLLFISERIVPFLLVIVKQRLIAILVLLSRVLCTFKRRCNDSVQINSSISNDGFITLLYTVVSENFIRPVKIIITKFYSVLFTLIEIYQLAKVKKNVNFLNLFFLFSNQ